MMSRFAAFKRPFLQSLEELVRERIDSASFLILVIASGMLGTVPILVALISNHGVGLMAQVIWRLILALPLIALFAVVFNGARSLIVHRRDITTFFGGGILVLLVFSAFMAAVAVGTQIVAVVFLANTSVLWAVILGRIILREEITTKKVLSLSGIIAGVAILTSPWTAQFTLSVGEMLALGSGFSFAAYLTFMRMKTSIYEPLTLTTWSFAAALLLLLLIISLSSFGLICACGGIADLTVDDQWPLLSALVLVGTAFPFVFLNTGLKGVQASIGGMVSLITPVISTVLSVVILNQGFVTSQGIGCALIIISIIYLYR